MQNIEQVWRPSRDQVLGAVLSPVLCHVWGVEIPVCAFLWQGMKEGPVFSASMCIRRPTPSSAGASAFVWNWKVDAQTKKPGKNCLFSETEDRSLSIGLGYEALWLLHTLPSYQPNLTIYPWDNEPIQKMK